MTASISAERVPGRGAPGALALLLVLAGLGSCAQAAAGGTPVRLALGYRPANAPPGDAVGDDGAWRTSLGQYAGEGLPLGPEEPARLEVSIPPGCSLRFFAAALHDAAAGEGAPAVLRVALDGREVLSAELPTALVSRGAWHSVALPAAGAPRAELAFSVAGGARAAVLSPVIAPVSATAPPPRTAARPDVIVFLADTFRADNLRAYGGDRGQAPALDRLAARSACFLRTWSPAAWTLPSQASLMTGLYPRQHGAVRNRLPIAPELETLAEVMTRNGYRTGAVTDSGFVSTKFGFDQGFQWFEENTKRDLAQTLRSARAFLEEDDGRPAFLFVHTYRTHHPYLVGPDDDSTGWDALLAAHPDENGGEELDRHLVPYAAELHELYDGAVSGLDQLFGPWFSALESDGLLDGAYFVFTSDHGEAFAEHDELKHGGLLWGEKIRVPLLVLGPGLEPGARTQPASLVDLPPTIAELVGIDRLPVWVGTSLVRAPDERPILAFGEELSRYPPHMAVISGDEKLMLRQGSDGPRDARIERAFDLEADPGEIRDVKDAGADWPQELWRGVLPLVERLSVPLARPEKMTLQRDLEQQLRGLGYSGK